VPKQTARKKKGTRALNDFIRSCLFVIRSRWRIIIFFNLLFFASIFVTIFVASLMFSPSLFPRVLSPNQNVIIGADWPETLLVIFFHNMGLVFFLATLPGILFFALPTIFPLYTAITWGLSAYSLTSSQFFVILPTLLLEGEGIVLSAMAGTLLGASWLMPHRLYPGEKLPRIDAFKKALGECLRIYFFVVVILFVAAAVETLTLFQLV
jgi:hypothetical protein